MAVRMVDQLLDYTMEIQNKYEKHRNAIDFLYNITDYINDKRIESDIENEQFSPIYKEFVRFVLTFIATSARGIILKTVGGETDDNINTYIDEQTRIAHELINKLRKFQETAEKGGIETFLNKLKERLSNIKELKGVYTAENALRVLDEKFGPLGIQFQREQADIDRRKREEEESERKRRVQEEFNKLKGDCLKKIETIHAYFAKYNNLISTITLLKRELLDLIRNDSDKNKLNQSIKEDCRTYIQQIDIPSEQDFNSDIYNINGLNVDKLAKKCKEIEELLESVIGKGDKLNDVFRTLVNFKEDLRGAVRIFVRVKPMLGGGTADFIQYIDPSASQTLNREGNQKIIFQGTPYGPFYNVFQPFYTNKDIYESLKTMWEQIYSGYHVALFGYGYSGSGKTYTLLNGNNNDYGIAIHVLEHFIHKKVPIHMTNVEELYVDKLMMQPSSLTGQSIFPISTILQRPFPIENTDTFIKTINEIENIRKVEGRIKATINNPESSRSHLFITLKIGEGFLTICDMGGRENPIEILQYTGITKQGFICTLENNVAQRVNYASTLEYYDIKNGRLVTEIEKLDKKNQDLASYSIESLTGYNVTTFIKVMDDNKVTKNDYEQKLLKFVRTPHKNSDVVRAIWHVYNTCKEGFYINETINHLTWYFKTLNNVKHTCAQMSKDLLPKGHYNINNCFEVPRTFQEGKDTILMIKKLKSLQLKESAKPTKFAMFACIRQENVTKFKEFSKKTLDFAQQVASTVVS